jgi:hypothetical protein
MKSSYAARITTSEVVGEAKFVTQTMLATSVALLDALKVDERRKQDEWNRGLVFGLQHRPVESK